VGGFVALIWVAWFGLLGLGVGSDMGLFFGFCIVLTHLSFLMGWVRLGWAGLGQERGAAWMIGMTWHDLNGSGWRGKGQD
jgi:hypothetical protein